MLKQHYISFRSCILFFLPFFIVELFGLLHFILLSSGIEVIMSKAVTKGIIKYDLLFFVGNKDKTGKQKLLSMQSAQIFFGCGPQLCYQIWLLHAILPSTDENERKASMSQYVSIIISILMMTKTSFELLSYQKEVDIFTIYPRSLNEEL